MRLFITSIRLAFLGIFRAGLRSFLTALGVLIGIAAVVIVIALGTGARESITSQIEGMGSNLVFVFQAPERKSGAKTEEKLGLTEGDVAALRREASAALAVTGWIETKAQVVSDVANHSTEVGGADTAYLDVRDFKVDKGRVWTESEEAIKAKVVVLGRTVAENLFGQDDPIGRTVRISKSPFVVIGLLERKGQGPFGDQDDRAILPITSYRARIQPGFGGRVNMIMMKARSAAHANDAARQAEEILRQRHHVREGEEPDFRIRTQAQFQESQDQIFTILTVLLVSVAAISLFVGGVGVMNIMLVSVTERTREIGIRMAIGATAYDIQLQFLVEAIAITLVGGFAGLLLATGVIEVIRRVTGWNTSVSIDAIALSLGVSVLVGLVFGWLPARRAAALDPIEALRHE